MEQGRNQALDLEQVEEYLVERTGAAVEVREVRQLKGEATGKQALKQFGYGQPIMVCYAVDGTEERVVFHRIRRNAFGREREDDRVAAVWLDFRTFNDLPRHAPALDLVMQTGTGAVQSIAEAEELWLVSGFRPRLDFRRGLPPDFLRMWLRVTSMLLVRSSRLLSCSLEGSSLATARAVFSTISSIRSSRDFPSSLEFIFSVLTGWSQA